MPWMPLKRKRGGNPWKPQLLQQLNCSWDVQQLLSPQTAFIFDAGYRISHQRAGDYSSCVRHGSRKYGWFKDTLSF